MAIVKNEYVIQAFLSDGTYPTFSIAVGLWGTKWCADNLYSHGTKHVFERSGELRISVVDEESEGTLHFLQLPNELARLLSCPESIGIRCDTSEMHSSCVYFNEEEHV